MIVFSVSILLIVVGIYSMWTKNPNFAPEENSDQMLNSEKYGDYVRKIGIIYLAIGVVLFLIELINVIWMIPTISSVIQLLSQSS